MGRIRWAVFHEGRNPWHSVQLHNQVHRRKHDTGTSRYIIIVVYYSGPFQYATFLDTQVFSLGDPYRSAAFFDKKAVGLAWLSDSEGKILGYTI